MTKKPRGRFGLPRLTDIGPRVSYHNTPPTECDVEFCFDGHTKREVFISIRDAYANNKDKIINTLRDEHIPVEEIVVSGSVVRGQFGCRDMNKVRDEINEVSDDVWEMGGEIPDDAVDVVENGLKTSSTPQELWNFIEPKLTSLKQEINDPIERDGIDMMLDDVKVGICSDIDLFVVFPDDASHSATNRWRTPELQRKTDPIYHDMNTTVKGEMVFIASESDESLQSKLDAPSISSIEGFNAIIDKYY